MERLNHIYTRSLPDQLTEHRPSSTYALRYIMLLSVLFIIPLLTHAQSPLPGLGFEYQRPITVDHTYVMGTANLTDFPMLVSLTEPYLATRPNGGKLYSESGYDVVFTDIAGKRLFHEIEYYNSTTGEYVAWVSIPSLNHSANTGIRMLYGNANITLNPSSAETWDPDAYISVWHMNRKNDTIYDSRSLNHGIIYGSESIEGRIDGAEEFKQGVEETDKVYINSFNVPGNQLTLSAWIRPKSVYEWGSRIISKASLDQIRDHTWMLDHNKDYRLRMRVSVVGGPNDDGLTATTTGISPNNWYYVSGTYNGAHMKVFQNGIEVGSIERTGNILQTDSAVAIGNQPKTDEHPRQYDGIIDEVRVLKVARTANWLQTEFNNQGNPDNFYTISAEESYSLTPDSVCFGDSTTYAIPALFDTYTWGVVGGTFLGATNDTSVSVIWNGSPPHKLWLTTTLGAEAGTDTVYITVTALPTPLITGDAFLCPTHSAGNTYSITSGVGHTYLWGVTGGTIDGPNTVDSVIVNWNSGNNQIYVRQSNSFGCAGFDTLGVLVLDTIPPVITANALYTVYLDVNGLASIDSAMVVTAFSDNCQADSVSILQTQFNCTHAGQTIDNYVVGYDVNGNSDTALFKVTVLDTIPPTAVCRDTLIYLDDLDGTMVINPPFIDNGSSDNCGIVSYEISKSLFTAVDTGVNIVWLTVRDAAGNSDSCSAQVTVKFIADPFVTVNPYVDTVCSNTAISVEIWGSKSSTKYSWLAEPQTGISGTISGTHADRTLNLTQTLTNHTDTFKYVDYHVTPRVYDTLDLQVETIRIYVEPVPRVTATPGIDTVCNGDDISFTFSSPTVPTRPVKFRYEVLAPVNVNVVPASGTGLTVDSLLTNQLVNNSDTAKLVRFVITPYIRYGEGEAERCAGINDTVYIWVEPTPAVHPVSTYDTLCSGDIISIQLISPTVPTRSVRFRYQTIAPSGVNVNPGIGSGINRNSFLTDQITNMTDSAQSVLFIITPYTRFAQGEAEKCTGLPDTVLIWVEPVPLVTFTPHADTLCSGDQLAVALASPTVSLNGVRIGVMPLPYHPDITVISGGSFIPSDTLYQTLSNNGDSARLVRYLITPYTLTGAGTDMCSGASDTLFVWVEPVVEVTVSKAVDTLCNNQTAFILFSSPTRPTRWVEVNVSVLPEFPDSVSGISGATGLLITGNINQQLTNLSDTAQKIIYVVNPFLIDGSGQQVCGGIADTTVIWLEPALRFSLSNSPDTLCNETATSIGIVSPSKPTWPVRFSYQVYPYNSGAFEPYTNGEQYGLFNLATISESLTNKTDTAQQVLIRITPYTTRDGSVIRCIDSPDTAMLWVEPTPKVNLGPNKDTICTNLHTYIGLTTPTQSLNPVAFRYEALPNPNAVVLYHGDTTGLSPGYSVADTIINLTGAPQLVRFRVFPYLRRYDGSDKCVGIADTALVWVAPTLVAAIDTVSTYQASNPVEAKNIRCFGENNGFIRLKPYGGITEFVGYSDADLQYSWSTGSSSRDISSLVAGDYSVIVTDKLNCLATIETLLTQPDSLQVSIGVVGDLTCNTGGNTIHYAFSGGTGNYTSLWKTVPDGYPLPDPSKDTLENVLFGFYEAKVSDINMCTDSVEFPLSILSPINVQMVVSSFYNRLPLDEPYNISCFGEDDGLIVLYNFSGDTINYSFKKPGFDTIHFSTDSDSIPFDNLVAGNYHLYYTDPNDCHNTKDEELIQPDSLMINTFNLSSWHDGKYNLSCHQSGDGSIALQTITGGHSYTGYTYHWEVFTGEGTVAPHNPHQHNLSSGGYRVTVTDTVGCYTTMDFVLSEPDSIVIHYNRPTVNDGIHHVSCFGGADGRIELNPAGGDTDSSPFTYNWEHGSTSRNLTNLAAGSYSVRVTDGIGCHTDSSISLFSPEALLIDSIRLSAYSGFRVSCEGRSDGSIQVFMGGGSPGYQYTWHKDGEILPPATSAITGLAEGFYLLTVTDTNGCQLYWDRQLDAPPAINLEVEWNNVNCSGSIPGNATAIASGGSGTLRYLWSTGDTTANAGGLTTGSYQVRVNDMYSCDTSVWVTIGQDSVPGIVFEEVSAVSCFEGSDGILRAIVTGGIQPYTYQWHGRSETDNTLSPIGAGHYKLTITDSKACISKDSITVDQPGHLSAISTVNPVSCFGFGDGFFTLQASGGNAGYTYLYRGAAMSGNSLSNLSSGIYNVGVIDQKGCRYDSVIFIPQPNPLLVHVDELNTAQPYCPGWKSGKISLLITGGSLPYLIRWQHDPGEQGASVENLYEGTYPVIVTDAHGCHYDTTIVMESKTVSCLDIPSAFTPNDDGVNDLWEIDFLNESGLREPFYERFPASTLHIYNRWGNLLWHCTGNCTRNWDGTDMSGRAMPVDSYYYILKIEDEGKNEQYRGTITIIR